MATLPPGGEVHRQHKAVLAPAEGERIVPGPQRAEPGCSLADQGPHLIPAAVLRLQKHFIHGAKILHGQLNAAQNGAGADAQGGIRFRIVSAKKNAVHGQQAAVGDYCSSFALTRYSPLPTPPNRYFPAALVLVTDTRRS